MRKIPENSSLPESCPFKLGYFYQLYDGAGLIHDCAEFQGYLFNEDCFLFVAERGGRARIPWEAFENGLIRYSINVPRMMQYQKECIERGTQSSEEPE